MSAVRSSADGPQIELRPSSEEFPRCKGSVELSGRNYRYAEVCGVSQPFVSAIRPRPGDQSDNRYQIDTVRNVERGGTTYQQNTANIGKSAPAGEATA